MTPLWKAKSYHTLVNFGHFEKHTKFEKKNIGRNPIVDCERNGEKNRKRMERIEKARIESKGEKKRKE